MEVFNGHQPHNHDLLVLNIWENIKINNVWTEEYELCPSSTELWLEADSNPSCLQLHTEASWCVGAYGFREEGGRKRKDLSV